jgi:hypothetical protein
MVDGGAVVACGAANARSPNIQRVTINRNDRTEIEQAAIFLVVTYSTLELISNCRIAFCPGAKWTT